MLYFSLVGRRLLPVPVTVRSLHWKQQNEKYVVIFPMGLPVRLPFGSEGVSIFWIQLLYSDRKIPEQKNFPYITGPGPMSIRFLRVEFN